MRNPKSKRVLAKGGSGSGGSGGAGGGSSPPADLDEVMEEVEEKFRNKSDGFSGAYANRQLLVRDALNQEKPSDDSVLRYPVAGAVRQMFDYTNDSSQPNSMNRASSELLRRIEPRLTRAEKLFILSGVGDKEFSVVDTALTRTAISRIRTSIGLPSTGDIRRQVNNENRLMRRNLKEVF